MFDNQNSHWFGVCMCKCLSGSRQQKSFTLLFEKLPCLSSRRNYFVMCAGNQYPRSETRTCRCRCYSAPLAKLAKQICDIVGCAKGSVTFAQFASAMKHFGVHCHVPKLLFRQLARDFGFVCPLQFRIELKDLDDHVWCDLEPNFVITSVRLRFKLGDDIRAHPNLLFSGRGPIVSV